MFLYIFPYSMVWINSRVCCKYQICSVRWVKLLFTLSDSGLAWLFFSLAHPPFYGSAFCLKFALTNLVSLERSAVSHTLCNFMEHPWPVITSHLRYRYSNSHIPLLFGIMIYFNLIICVNIMIITKNNLKISIIW